VKAAFVLVGRCDCGGTDQRFAPRINAPAPPPRPELPPVNRDLRHHRWPVRRSPKAGQSAGGQQIANYPGQQAHPLPRAAAPAAGAAAPGNPDRDASLNRIATRFRPTPRLLTSADFQPQTTRRTSLISVNRKLPGVTLTDQTGNPFQAARLTTAGFVASAGSGNGRRASRSIRNGVRIKRILGRRGQLGFHTGEGHRSGLACFPTIRCSASTRSAGRAQHPDGRTASPIKGVETELFGGSYGARAGQRASRWPERTMFPPMRRSNLPTTGDGATTQIRRT